MDPACNLDEVIERAVQPVRNPPELRLESMVTRQCALHLLKLEAERYELLLHPVVQIALDAAARFVRGSDDPTA